MKKLLTALAVAGMTVALVACTGTGTTTGITSDAAECAAALVATGSTDITTLATAAAGNKYCQALAADGLKAIMDQVGKINFTTARINAAQHH